MTVPPPDGIALDIRGSVATIVFDWPRTHNAMRLKTWLALPAMIAAAEREAAVGALVLRGARGQFGTGNDLVEFGAVHGRPDAARAFGNAMAGAMRAVEEASKPVVVAIEGLCYGASVALALAGDVRLASSDAVLAITPAKIGALYLQSDLHRLVSAVGPGQSRQLIYSAEPISASNAHRIGLVDEMLAAAQFEAGLTARLDAILRGSPNSLRHSKRMLRRVNPTPEETAQSLDAFVEATQGDDFREGVSAFLAKRSPRFR